MERNPNLVSRNHHHVINICDEPKLLKRSGGRSSCSIFRVPQSLMEIHPKAFQPQLVSIGPYHHGKEHLCMIQEHKKRFLDANIVTRTQESTLGDLYKAIAERIEEIKECYSESLSEKFSDHELIEMMVLDGCFVIGVFCKLDRLAKTDDYDPIFIVPWIFHFLIRDLLKLENQISLFVLEILYNILSNHIAPKVPSLTELALKFFAYAIVKIPNTNENFDGKKHLLDLVRFAFIPPTQKTAIDIDSEFLGLIQPTEKLRGAGIKFEARKADSFLDINFRPGDGVLEIPVLTVDDFTSSFMLNCIAFEQCYRYCSNHFTSYAVFIGCLMNTPMDAGYLRDEKIIENYFGTDKEVVKFFNKVGQDVIFNITDSSLSVVFEDINKYYRNEWHVRWASFKNTYFDTPWVFLSASAALVLLILTFIQTFFAVYGYSNPP